MEIAMRVVGGATPAGSLLTGTLLGCAVGALAALAVILVVRKEAKTKAAFAALQAQVWLQLLVGGLLLGGWLGYTLFTPENPPDWFDDVHHGLLLLVIGSSAWFWYAALGLLADPQVLVNAATGRDARRLQTQAQVLRRVGRVTVVALALSLGLLTFPETRAPVTSLLASAGVISVVAGLAAQTTLASMFAGFQLAFTDAIRVGDTVVIQDQDQPGSIEEITLTYVVVRIWDERRIILPSTEFTTKPFENWTRSKQHQLAVTTLQLGWDAPVAEIRAEVGRLVEDSDLWDGRTWSVQVFTVNAHYLELRIVVSADNWAIAWDLRSYVRENIVAWIREHAPQSIPRDLVRLVEDSPEGILGTEELDRAALRGPLYVGPAGGGHVSKGELMKADPDQLMADEIKKVRQEAGSEIKVVPKKKPRLLGKFLFSGSREAAERAKMYSGPGEKIRHARVSRAQVQREQAEQSQPDQ